MAERQTEYEACSVCRRVFPVGVAADGRIQKSGQDSALMTHSKQDHDLVRVRIGSNYTWVHRSQIKGGRLEPIKRGGA